MSRGGLPSNASRRHQPSSVERHILPGGRESHPDRATFPLSDLNHRNGGKVGGNTPHVRPTHRGLVRPSILAKQRECSWIAEMRYFISTTNCVWSYAARRSSGLRSGVLPTLRPSVIPGHRTTRSTRSTRYGCPERASSRHLRGCSGQCAILTHWSSRYSGITTRARHPSWS